MTQRLALPSRQSPRLARPRRILGISPFWWGLALLVLLTLFFASTQSSYNLYVYDSVLLTCIGAVALQVLQGTAGLVSVGSAGFLMVGAFGSVFFLRAGFPFPADVICATVAAGVVGLITGLPALRLRALFLALATLAAYYIVLFVANWYESDIPSARSAGFSVPILFSSAGLLQGSRDWAWLLLACVILVALGARCIMGGRSGRALRVMREHEHIAPTLGVSVARYKLALFTLSSCVIGLEGGLMAHFLGSLTVESFSLTLSFQYVAMIIIGGVDSIAGALIGAAIVVALPVYVPTWVGGIVGSERATTYGPNIALIIYGLLIVFFTVASPDGVVGLLTRLRNLAGALLRRWAGSGKRAGSQEGSAVG